MNIESFELGQLIRDNASKIEIQFSAEGDDDRVEDGDTLELIDPVEALPNGRIRIHARLPEA